MTALRRPILAVFAAALAALVAGPARAQELELPRPRQGYYAGGGLYGAATRIEEDGESLGTWPGYQVMSHFGQMVTARLGLGLGIASAGTFHGSEVASLTAVSLEGQWEPMENLALRGGVGFGVVALVDEEEPDAELRGSFGGAYTLALSYDLFVYRKKTSGGLSLVPTIGVRFLPDSPVETAMGFFGVAVVYWTGLPTNELNLPAGEGYGKPD